MKAETNLLPTQPTTHTCSSHWRECFLCEDYSLSQGELQLYYGLKQEANILFDGPNQRWDLIKSLYSEYFGTDPKVSGKEFMQLGFQGQYPETDFRGGGVLSLQLILRFVKRNKDLVKRMENDSGNFFFAITAINLCFFMKKYFHLADFLIPRQDVHTYCNRRAFKNFCRLLEDNQQTYFQLHEIFLKYFYTKIWTQALKRNENTLLIFNSLFESLTKKIKQLFEEHTLLTFRDGLDIWLENGF